MAITVKHTKVSTIPDAGDASLIEPSDWNADHQLVGTVPVANGGTGAATLTGYVVGTGTTAMTAVTTIPSTDVTGLGTMSTQNSNNVSITGGSMSGVTISDYVANATKGVANGVASLDNSGTVPVSQLPAAVLGALSYQGTWNATTNTPTLTSSTGTKGYYYVVSVAGTTNLNGITDWQVGDWAVYNGSAWQKIDNTDAVTSVNGYTGTVVLTQTDISGTVPTSRTITAGTGLTGGGDLSANRTLAIATTGVSAATYGSASIVPVIAVNTQGQITSATNTTIAIANTQVSGLGTMSTQNANAVAVTGGTINGTTIGATTASSGAFTVLSTSNTTSTTPTLSFNGSNSNMASGAIVSGSYLQNLLQNKSGTANASTNYVLSNDLGTDSTYYGEFGMNSSVYSSGTPTDFFSLNNGVYFSSHDGDVTVGSGNGYKTYFAWGTSGQSAHVINATGAIGLNTSITGSTNFGTSGQVLTSAGSGATPTWTTPTTGTVTSVTGTSPVVSSGGNTPAISMPAATTSVSGYLTSTDWNTFNGKSNTNGTVTSVAALTLGTTGTDLSSTVANGTTTPVITLQVPTASASNRGALSSTDWSTFNGKQAALVSGTNIKTVAGVSLLGSGDVGLIGGTYGGTGVNNGASTITVGGNINYSGAYTQTWTRTANTSLTLPVSGTVLSSVTAPATNPISGTPSSSNYLRGDGTWSAVSVSAAGSNTQIQYNNSGAFGASSSFTFDGTTNTSPVQAASNGFFVNPNTNTSSYTIPSGSNAVTAGKFTVATSTTITVSTGSRWVVV